MENSKKRINIIDLIALVLLIALVVFGATKSQTSKIYLKAQLKRKLFTPLKFRTKILIL